MVSAADGEDAVVPDERVESGMFAILDDADLRQEDCNGLGNECR